jgi:predicted nucleic acid-binding protein
MKDSFFIDSNIFLYAFSDKDDDKQKISKNIVSSRSVVSVQVVNEVSKNLLYKLSFDEDEIIKFIESLYKKHIVAELTKTVFIHASNIRKKYNFSYYDSIIVTTALENECNVLYSEDMQHNQIVDDKLTIINPFRKLLENKSQ